MKNNIIFSLAAVVLLSSCSYSSPVCAEWTETVDYSVWKGEKIHAMAVIKADTDLEAVSVCVTGDKNADACFVFDVKGDVFSEKFDQSGPRLPGQFDSIIVADRIGPENVKSLSASEERPVWVSVRVPFDARTGQHKLTLKVKAPGMRTVNLPLTYNVVDEVLPEPSQWRFDLDLWQNPYSVARYFGVPLWSEDHFELMKPLFRRLADAGQKVVTTTVIDRPWNGQTEDPFESMVVKTLGTDGAWTYDYSVFDRWVEFMFSLGIDKQIKCFSLIPWKHVFDYVDAATGGIVHFEAAPGTEKYNWYWSAFINDFATHLKEKGWFEKTMLAMDERPRKDVMSCLEMVRGVEPEFRISFSGKYPGEVQQEFADVCIGATQSFPDSVISYRRDKGYICAFYTCCAEKYPNVFLASIPQEAAWFGWFALAHNLNGYHRWSYNSWTRSPVEDARFRRWPAGDCYSVYPESTSVRFENIVEGIQDFEKACILRDRWTAEGDTTRLNALEKALGNFNMDELGANGPLNALNEARKVISE